MDLDAPRRILEQNNYFAGSPPLVAVRGLSSPRVEHFLNQMVRALPPNECYLEVGTFRGRTLLAAALHNRDKLCIGCDRFRALGRFTGLGILAKRDLLRNIARYRNRSATITFHHMTSRKLFETGLVTKSVGLYFYDGDHSYGGTFHGIVAGSTYLAEEAVLLIDDWNDPVIRQATSDALEQAALEIHWHEALPGEHGCLGWWNGVGAFAVRKQARSLRRAPIRGNAPVQSNSGTQR